MSEPKQGRSRGGARLRGWWLGLVPGLFVLDLCLPVSDSLPTGIPDALGCSGTGGGAGSYRWAQLTPVTDGTDAPAPIASDGFFTFILAGLYGLSAEEAQSQVQVRVTDAGGAEISGDVRLLAQGSGYSFTFGWSAREPLALGAHLNAELVADPSTSTLQNVGPSVALEVVGAPTPLPEPQLLLSNWARYYQGDGGSVTCSNRAPSGYSSSCDGDGTITVPAQLRERISVQASWTPPAIAGGVAWRLQVQAPADSAAPMRDTLFWGVDPGSPLPFGVVVLPDVEGRQCVSLVIEDLRSGEQRRGETCAERGPLEGFATDTQLARCNAPPNAELTRAWCDLRPASGSPLCATTGAEESASPRDVTTSSSTAETSATEDGADSEESGCQLGVPSSTGGLSAALAALAACAALRVRRRRGA